MMDLSSTTQTYLTSIASFDDRRVSVQSDNFSRDPYVITFVLWKESGIDASWEWMDSQHH
jgi:hypothetical protein